MTSCNGESLSRFLDGELGARQMQEVVAHLAACPKCEREYAMLTELHALSKDVFPHFHFPRPAVDKLRRRVWVRAATWAAAALLLLTAGGATLAALREHFKQLSAQPGGHTVRVIPSNAPASPLATPPPQGESVSAVSRPASEKAPEPAVPEKTVPPPGERMLRGVVMDSAGVPLAGAWVTLASDSATTDSAGEFVLPYPKGRNNLEVRRAGYSPLHAPVPAEITGADMEVFAYLDSVGGAAVTGKVTDAAGAPVAGALIRGLVPRLSTPITDEAGMFTGVAQDDLWVEHPRYAAKKAEIRPEVPQISVSLKTGGSLRVRVLRGNAPVASARVTVRGPLPTTLDNSTDDAGYVQFDHLPSAEYSLTAHTARGDMTTSRSGSTLVKNGETTECSLLVPESYPCTLRGKVMDEDGAPVPNAALFLSPEGYPDAVRQVPLGNDGVLSVGLELGRTIAYVSPGEEWQPVGEGKRVVSAVTVGDNLYEEFRFRRAAPCDVTILDMGGVPLEQAYIATVGGFQSPQGKIRFLLTMPSGHFQFTPFSITSLMACDLEMKQGGSVLLDQAQSAGVKLRLDRSLTTVSGKVTEPDGTPLPRIHVRLFRKEESQRDCFGSAYACSSGQGLFDLGPLAVGATYDGCAFSVSNPPAVTSIPIHLALEQNPQPLHLVVTPRNAVIRGTVVYADGLPVQNESASVSAVAGEAMAGRASTGKTGVFELTLAPGEYTLYAQTASGQQGPQVLVTAPSDGLVLSIPEDAPEAGVDAESPEGPEHERAKQVLHDMGIVFKMFANEAKEGTFPPLDTTFGAFRPVMEVLYPEYVSDPSTVARVSGRETVKLCYPGYAVTDEAAGMAFLDAYEAYGPDGLAGEDIENDETSQGAILRLREGIDRFFITDINDPSASSRAQASIPVLWEVPGNRAESGGWVLYMDGHIAWKPYPGEFPMTEAFITRLRSLMTE